MTANQLQNIIQTILNDPSYSRYQSPSVKQVGVDAKGKDIFNCEIVCNFIPNSLYPQSNSPNITNENYNNKILSFDVEQRFNPIPLPQEIRIFLHGFMHLK